MSETLLEFARFLRDVPEGDIDEALIDSIISQLSEIWDELKGGDRTSMDSLKVQRGHSFSWQPETCTLRFEIERHGSVVMGSSKAERQRWEIDLKHASASSNIVGYRLLTPRLAGLNTSVVVSRIVALVAAGPSDVGDGSIVWKNGYTLTITPGKFLPDDGATSQTRNGRTSAIRKALKPELDRIGWKLDIRGPYWKLDKTQS